MDKVLLAMNSYSIEFEAIAKAFVVNKYNAGITLFKQNNKGDHTNKWIYDL